MIIRSLRIGAAAGALLALAACAGIKAVPAGPYVHGGTSMTVGRTWTDLGLVPGSPKALRMLTIDGPALNTLFVIDGLKDGEYIVRATSKERPTPTYRRGISPSEQVEFLADSTAAIGFQRVETDNIRPVTVSGVDGVRVDLTAQTAAGLNVSGTAQLVEVGGRLYILFYVAPTEHYFEATRAEVEAIMGSAKITG
ncbi:MAG TPA: hypothetical protein PLF78_05760 [Caulobacter sp.]|nr:hypothetical protein [Caulobacter sp.]